MSPLPGSRGFPCCRSSHGWLNDRARCAGIQPAKSLHFGGDIWMDSFSEDGRAFRSCSSLPLSIAVIFSGIRLQGAICGRVLNPADHGGTNGLQQSALFPGCSRHGSHPEWIADLEHAPGLGHRGVGPDLGFRRFRQISHRARTQFYIAVDGGNCRSPAVFPQRHLRVLRLAPFHGRGQVPERQLTAD